MVLSAENAQSVYEDDVGVLLGCASPSFPMLGRVSREFLCS